MAIKFKQIEGNVDLSNYYTKEETQSIFMDETEVNDKLENYYTKSEVDSMIGSGGSESSSQLYVHNIVLITTSTYANINNQQYKIAFPVYTTSSEPINNIETLLRTVARINNGDEGGPTASPRLSVLVDISGKYFWDDNVDGRVPGTLHGKCHCPIWTGTGDWYKLLLTFYNTYTNTMTTEHIFASDLEVYSDTGPDTNNW